MMTKDKEKEVVAPQESVEATQETNTEVNPYAGWISSMGDTYAQQKAEKDAAEAKYKEAIDKLHTARANNRSAMYALLEEQKPTYDYDREKRERNKATIKALGDVLSAVTAGAHAYGKNGAGVVPTLASNSPYKEIEKINKMQEEYRKRNEAWKALDIKMRTDEEKAKLAAAEALKTKSEKDLEDAIADVNATREAVNKGMLEIGKAERKEQGANARAVMRETEANKRALYNAQIKAEGKAGTKGNESTTNLTPEEMNALMVLFDGYTIDSKSETETPIINPFTGEDTGKTKTTKNKRSKEFGEFTESDWENFAVKNHGMVNLLRKAKEGENLSGSQVVTAFSGLNDEYWDAVINLYTDPDNKFSLDTVIDYVKSTING